MLVSYTLLTQNIICYPRYQIVAWVFSNHGPLQKKLIIHVIIINYISTSPLISHISVINV